MSKPSTMETSAEPNDDAPMRQADISAGKLVLRKRTAGVAALPIRAEKTQPACKPSIRVNESSGDDTNPCLR